jgi:ribosomal protein S18 acetylase RimI-like enzyme
MTMQLQIRPTAKIDQAWIEALLQKYWGSTQVVSRGQIHQADQLPGFVAVLWGQNVGLATYHLADRQCEIVTINSLVERQGIGTALIDAARAEAAKAHCARLWLVTTNDNLAALRFYQKRGFNLVRLHPNAVERSRQLKPDIPLIGRHGIPIRDEIELELELR